MASLHGFALASLLTSLALAAQHPHSHSRSSQYSGSRARRAQSIASAPVATSVWPLPRQLVYNATGMQPMNVDAFLFTTSASSNTSALEADILQAAYARYLSILGTPRSRTAPTHVARDAAPFSTLTGVTVSCECGDTDPLPSLYMDESYSIILDGSASGIISCTAVFGCLRALETFSQLVVRPAAGGVAVTGVPLGINDIPRFTHRGLMIDTSRHFLPLGCILTMIDALAYDKLNVLHWHMSDVQSFPFDSAAVPGLSAGAWAPQAVYTHADVVQVVTYARYRGVAVVPEFDSPAHSESWAVGVPGILINYTANPYLSVLDVTSNATYDVYTALVNEVASLFPDARFHLGVDEVNFDVLNCTAVNGWMASHGYAAGDYKALVRYYMSRAQATVLNAGKVPMYWQEAFDHYGTGTENPTPPPALLSNESIVYLWFCPCWDWANMGNVTAYGLRGIKTDDWYMDDLNTAWSDVYAVEPLTDGYNCNFSAGYPNCTCPTGGCTYNITDPAQVARVLGGEAAAWSEHMDATMIQARVWPRMSAIAERLWSSREVNDPVAATQRITDHRCRLVSRGLSVEPVQPDFCDGTRR